MKSQTQIEIARARHIPGLKSNTEPSTKRRWTLEQMLLERIGGLTVVEYSGVQKCFHVETVAEMLRSNRRCFGRGGMVDYVPLAIVGSYEEAHRLCDEIERRFGHPGTAQEAYDNGR